MYPDEAEKIKYYRKKITGELLRTGIPPDSAIVEEAASRIDSRLALFRYKAETAGEDFDTGKFNGDFSAVWEDLLILYRTVFAVCVRELGELEEFADSRLKELDFMVKKYREKADFERNSAGFGRTVYMASGGFNVRIENNTASIDLGSIETTEGAELACFIEGESVEKEKVVFSFDGKNCSPYEFNREYIRVPGNPSLKQWFYELPEEQLPYGVRRMNPEGSEFSKDNSYVIYAGKNRMKAGNAYIEKPGNAGITIEEEGTVSFWLTGATFIDFLYSDEPEETNFSGRNIRNTDRQKAEKYTIKHGRNFSLDVVTDGTVYAERKDGCFLDGCLYYSNNDELTDFLIEETSAGEKVLIENAKVLLADINPEEELKISYIAVKELTDGKEMP